MSIRLRGHHLLCLMTYVGRGYTPAFTAHYDALVLRLDAGEPAELVEGPDDICTPMLGEAGHHCLNDSVVARDARARAALAGLFGGGFAPGDRLDLSAPRLAAMRAAFASGASRAACVGCQWTRLCDDIAAGGFRRVRLKGTPAESGAPDISLPDISLPCGSRSRD
ncbi:DUF1284 domain-containing protein [Ancylobacter oerskovii]|uniref:DUF1284 domain-containing protein n=1 Tax=Ancylobacter oerskovii TaxID=459519 RepID=A0ABW4YWY3_9HYPH|nr:DUF1284 domain-containing protein [Ancylobacter oerskovii]MBS7542358.1 DUF1284 domain-containing protein [Ancylobacter oerskovii]